MSVEELKDGEIEELFKKQEKAIKECNGIIETPFVSRSFKCWSCNRDLLTDEKTLKEAREGILIVGCPFCHRSFCD